MKVLDFILSSSLTSAEQPMKPPKQENAFESEPTTIVLS